ncbi:pyridine nucleotide-disulfide oxidoreductase domain-containing protein 2 isoform X3 [Canis lupus baileyi]|uniref:pyridine nucleotide-disulfide oxidoreductase domain-containing protein 2 isoform X3 n=1 Tax=Canis lupus baileyi TaxID=143281 RepID=UPI003B973778
MEFVTSQKVSHLGCWVVWNVVEAAVVSRRPVRQQLQRFTRWRLGLRGSGDRGERTQLLETGLVSETGDGWDERKEKGGTKDTSWKHGLRLHLRNPYSFTPMLEESMGSKVPRSLLLGTDMAENQKQIAQFSRKDAQAFPKYEAFMNRLALAIDPLLDAAPVDMEAFQRGSLWQRLRSLSTLKPLLQAGRILGAQLPQYYQVLTTPIIKVLDQWFESEPLKATLATDAVIGAMTSPHTPGSGYVLLHHVMGGLEGMQGAWGYVQGGMGALSDAITSSATAHGASIFTEKAVAKVLVSSEGRVQGVVLQDGSEVRSKVVLSNASPQVTFLKLTPQEWLPKEFVERISRLDTKSPVTKINVAVDRLPDFLAAPNAPGGQPLPHHQCSIHLNCEDTLLLHQAFEDAMDGLPSHRPMIELCIPSSLDPTLAPPGCHVVSLFTQYTPYSLARGKVWDEQERNAYADKVFDCIEAYAPGFKGSVVGRDILTPPDLERIFGLPGGNIFHCAMTLDQLYFARPTPLHSGYHCPLRGLYLCGSGTHPVPFQEEVSWEPLDAMQLMLSSETSRACDPEPTLTQE